MTRVTRLRAVYLFIALLSTCRGLVKAECKQVDDDQISRVVTDDRPSRSDLHSFPLEFSLFAT